MTPDLSQIFTLLQFVLIPVLIIVILALIMIIVGLARELQRLRSSRPSSQASYPYPISPPPEARHREEVVNRSSQSDVTVPSPPSRRIPPDLDDPLKDERWLKLVEECVGLYDDLDRHFADFDSSRQELAEHVLLQLQEILERSAVELIAGDTTFERRLHQPESASGKVVPGTPIIKTLSPGFAVGRRVLRRARVRVAEVSS